MLRPLPLVVALALLVPSFANAQQKVDRAAAAKQIEANERAVNDALAKGDVATFNKFVAADAIGIDPAAGVSSVAEFVKMIPQAKVESWAIDNFRVTWINDTTALTTFRWTGKGSMMGQPFPSPTWASSIWVNRGGNWVGVFHQETTAVAPQPAKK